MTTSRSIPNEPGPPADEGYWRSLEAEECLPAKVLSVASVVSRRAPAEWEPIVALEAVRDLPTFPTEVLPDWARSLVEHLASATQTPADLPGCLVLAALATAAGGRAVVEVRPGWIEPLNIYTAVALPPGERKSPVFARVTRPLATSERDAIEAARPVVIEAQTRRTAAQKAAEAARTRAGATADDAREQAIQEAVNAELMAEAVTVPTLPRLLADDATPEALASLLVEQGGRIAVLSDEGEVFEIMAGRYSKNGGPSLGVFLKSHNGSALRVDRKGRPPEYVEAPALTLGLAVQPDVLRSIADRPGFRGRGLLGRFLWSLPTPNVGRRIVGAPPVPDAVSNAYDKHLADLVAALAEWTDPAVLPFTADASAELLALEADLEPRLAPSGDLGHVADWAAKLAGHVARLAGLLHLAASPTAWSRPVEAGTVARAVDLGHYFTDHALAVFALMGASPDLTAARLIAEWCRGRDTFTQRDAHRANQAAFPEARDLDRPLALLEERGYIRRQPAPPPSPHGGRPPSPAWEVHPSWT